MRDGYQDILTHTARSASTYRMEHNKKPVLPNVEKIIHDVHTSKEDTALRQKERSVNLNINNYKISFRQLGRNVKED